MWARFAIYSQLLFPNANNHWATLYIYILFPGGNRFPYSQQNLGNCWPKLLNSAGGFGVVSAFFALSTPDVLDVFRKPYNQLMGLKGR